MNLLFKNFVLAFALIFVAACSGNPAQVGDAMMDDDVMMGEEMEMGDAMMSDEGAGYDVLANSTEGEDQWASIEIIAADSAESASEFMTSNGFDRGRFDTNSSELYWVTQNALKAQARFLEENPDYNIVIEGHADERGTDEFNLALGERRANTAREYLVAQGVDPLRVEVVSFGEERPVETCSDESCWSQNRRFVTTIKTDDDGDEAEGDEGDVFDF